MSKLCSTLARLAITALATGACVSGVAAAASWRAGDRPQMPPFGAMKSLTQKEAADLTEYVLALSRLAADEAAVLRAAPLYDRHCVACHGAAGEGDPERGVPGLTDPFRFGDQPRRQVLDRILHGHGGDQALIAPAPSRADAGRPRA